LESLENFEEKNSKKTRVYFKIFDQNQIQKFKATRPIKFMKVQNGVKSGKPTGFLKNCYLSRSPLLH
jgi:hypothetical protein